MTGQWSGFLSIMLRWKIYEFLLIFVFCYSLLVLAVRACESELKILSAENAKLKTEVDRLVKRLRETEELNGGIPPSTRILPSSGS